MIMSRQLACAITLALLLATVSAAPGTARSGSTAQPLLATLDGQQVPIAVAAQYHCHDLIAGQLTCFSSPEERDEAVALLGPQGSTAAGETMPLSPNGYLMAYVDILYGGGSVVLSHDYDNLGDIGWNDRISSYRVYTSLGGVFYTNANLRGDYQSFCCFADVSYVGDFFNDKFSSIDLP
jgi:hypothetical protein